MCPIALFQPRGHPHFSVSTSEALQPCAVIEFPPTTFAQAGTRTKTAVLYLQKGRSTKPTSVFMGVSRDLGFQVSSRKGVQIKVAAGKNDLHDMLTTYCDVRSRFENGAVHVLSQVPSCVTAPEAAVLKGSWTPSHYSAARFATVEAISRNADFELIPLRNLVEFCAEKRKCEAWSEGRAFISVLHILGEGFVDVGSAMTYAPKTPGVRTNRASC